jgi:hypothetical protein
MQHAGPRRSVAGQRTSYRDRSDGSETRGQRDRLDPEEHPGGSGNHEQAIDASRRAPANVLW